MSTIKTEAEIKRNRLAWAGRVALVLALAMATLGLLLALAIPLTMPTGLLMQVRIGVSELSLWLVGFNVLAAVLSLFALRGTRLRAHRAALVALICSLVGCIIAA